jgi:uracil-DNA glycosylase
MEFEKIGNDWDEIIGEEFKEDYFKKLQKFLDDEYANKSIHICPSKENIFNAFRLTSFADTRVVILGQDPYPNREHAHGLAFSVPQGVELPRCLRHIYNEIDDEFPEGSCARQDGCLDRWATQGVLLLNTVLTVREGKVDKERNHRGRGWEKFTDMVIEKLSKKTVIFMLWGKEAQKKEKLISAPPKFVLKSAHPCYPHQGFKGCGHFKIANNIINEIGLGAQIDWQKHRN